MAENDPFYFTFCSYSVRVFDCDLFSKLISGWAWVPLTIVYWGSLSFFILFFKGDKPIKLWLQRPQPSKAAVFFNVILGMFPLSILLLNYHLFDSMLLIILWLLFALINPWLEELYWRGVLLDAVVDRFPKWVGVLYTTSLFVLSHPLMWGVFSIASTSYHLYIYLSIMGMVWSITHFKTRTLRWVIFSHFIVDIGNITVLTFLNIYIPPNMQLLVSGITKRQNKANGPFMVPDTRRSLFRWKKRVE